MVTTLSRGGHGCVTMARLSFDRHHTAANYNLKIRDLNDPVRLAGPAGVQMPALICRRQAPRMGWGFPALFLVTLLIAATLTQARAHQASTKPLTYKWVPSRCPFV